MASADMKVRRDLPLSVPQTKRERKDWHGPIEMSNWIIKGRLMAGAHPSWGKPHPNLKALFAAGIDTMVQLQHDSELDWVQDYTSMAHKLKDDLSHTRLSIRDHGVAPDERIEELAVEVTRKLQTTDAVIYIHCFGGNGRTGTLDALVLCALGKHPDEALAMVELLHHCREYPMSVAPETDEQCEQVRRVGQKLYDRATARSAAAAADPPRSSRKTSPKGVSKGKVRNDPLQLPPIA